jgi:hypothetical protein
VAQDSPVLVDITTRGKFVVVGVSGAPDSQGALDREGVFERPSRATRTRGFSAEPRFGLYRAREIAIAHGGNLEQVGSGRVAFQLSLPKASSSSEG